MCLLYYTLFESIIYSMSLTNEIDQSEIDVDEYFYGKKSIHNIDDDNISGQEDIKLNVFPDENIVIGIDLGTTNSCVAIWRKNNLEIIPDKYGNRTIPSVVSFTQKSRYIGKEAKKQIELNTENTFYEIKRLIGRKYDDDTVINDKQFITYEIDHDDQNNVVVISKLKNKKNIYTPEEISSMLLMELKYMAEEYLKCSVTKAVITVPAYFNDAQRQATKDAAIICGLECIRIINEPTSAALAYGFQKVSIHKGNDLNIIVYDLGGGTLDVSVLNISNGIFQVLGSSGNTHLGGVDFDNRIISHCINEFKKKYKYEKLDDLSSMSFQKLKQSCEEAKKRLSETKKTIVAVKDFYEDKNLFMTITKETINTICKDLFILCLKSVDDVLKSCNIDKESIDEILLVGGGTRMPQIRNNLKLYFKGKEPNSSINPDEVVAAGAAIQGYMLSHESDPFSENVVLLDIISLSLGVEVIGGIMNVLIPRNSIIPIKRKRKYTTDSDFETSVHVKIYEGERKMTKNNFLVGEFELFGIDSAPRGIAQIEITFSVDINGIINVSALDLKNNDNTKTININSNKGRLSPDKIKELILEAKQTEAKDKIEREKMQLFYEIEDLCSNIKINTDDNEFKLKEKDKIIVIDDVNKIFNWLKEKNYCDRTKKEYLKILSTLKKKYGTLILKVTHEMGDLKAATNDLSKLESTTVYGNDADEDNNDIYEEIENEELGIKDIVDEEIKKEIRRLRDELSTLCYSIFDIITSDSLIIDKNYIAELKEYIDDILLWVHVKEKITVSEYKQKIDEINTICNDIVDKHNSEFIFDSNLYSGQIKTKKDELEQLCYALMSSIMSNILALHEKHIQQLKIKVSETLDWIIEIEIQNKKENCDVPEMEYQNKINELNGLCDKLYESIINTNGDQNNNIDELLKSINTSVTSNMGFSTDGTSIADLRSNA